MKDLESLSLRVEKNIIFVLNQQKLPHITEWLQCHSPQEMHDIIYSLQVRGAPLIGIAAALSLAKFVEDGANEADIYQAAALLKSARPTAVNLAHCINKQVSAYENSNDPKTIITIAENLFLEDAVLCEKIAKNGFHIIDEDDNVLTHCNTGSLVTTGQGTALGIISHAYQSGKNLHVYVDETRPLLQGARLTAWELHQTKIPYTLICDNMAASLMQAGKIQKIIVGADRIAKNGDFANKIGTYNLAVLAHFHQIPFYVAAPYTTVDLSCNNGNEIIVEERNGNEVRGYNELLWCDKNTPVFNPSFDVTPGKLVTAFILDQGVYNAKEIGKDRLKPFETAPFETVLRTSSGRTVPQGEREL